jgi:membrane associated rhomboid family serine protease
VIYLYFVIPVRAIWCIAIFAAITLYSLWAGTSDGVSHIAHLGGMAFGIGWFGLARYRTGLVNLLKEVRKRRLRRKLRLIRRGGPDDEPPADTYDNKTIH